MKKILLSLLLLLSNSVSVYPYILFNYPEDGSLERMPGRTVTIDDKPYKIIAEFTSKTDDYHDNQNEITSLTVHQRLTSIEVYWFYFPKYVVIENIKSYYSMIDYTHYQSYNFNSLEEIKERFKDKFEFIIENFQF